MRLYDQYNITTLDKSDETKSSRDIQIWISIMKNGIRHYIRNADSELKLIVDKDLFLPVVIPNSQFDNSYVCSPYSQYIDYGYREIDIELSDRPIINKISKGILKAFEKCTPRHAFDKVIFVNNWFASTNLYPEIPVQIAFDSPNYKLTVGNFRTRNEALKIKHQISKNFPGAYPVPIIIDPDLLEN